MIFASQSADSVGRTLRDIHTLVKFAEGGFNRTFLITMRDGFEMVARIPYPVTVPKFYAIASEVATMRFLRFIKGTNLSDVWPELEDPDIVSVLRQLAELESRFMSIPFPAGGSLYFTKDLEKVTGRTGIPLNDERFCVGPEARLHMWYGRRSQLNVDSGPYTNPEAVLVAAARKELAYLELFGRPLLPFQRERRESYGHKEQSPPSNIIVSRSPDSNQLKIVSLLDWQHASILPLFLHAKIPGLLQKYDDPVSQALITPSLPANMDELDDSEQSFAKELYFSRFVHFHYVKNTEHEKLQVADENFEGCRGMVGFETETWVPNEHYEMAMKLAELIKLRVLTAVPEEEVRAKFQANWFLDDMDETDYL
ncbi:hypothetical protein CPB85DRAFT_1252623 [Mucidula mucida]|nr:hypothetical protein CPB85DRAFT_1252623 [Mucidula mucida]